MKNKVGATCINVLIELDCIFVTLGSVLLLFVSF